jgi:hypothetical protein
VQEELLETEQKTGEGGKTRTKDTRRRIRGKKKKPRGEIEDDTIKTGQKS